MPLTTRPPGPRTGASIPECYAAKLLDCGGPITLEHYVSKTLLLRFGNRFQLEGPYWSKPGQYYTEKSLRAGNLCERHNTALSALDETIGRLHEVLCAAHQTINVGVHDFDGEDLERWALKVMLGLIASGSFEIDGERGRPSDIPETFLRILFGEEEMPAGCGFYYIGEPVPALDADLLGIGLERHKPGDLEAGAIYGITLRLVGFQFLTSMTLRLQPGPQNLRYRPHGFFFDEPDRGRLRLSWGSTPSEEVLLIKMRATPVPA